MTDSEQVPSGKDEKAHSMIEIEYKLKIEQTLKSNANYYVVPFV